MSTEQVLKCDYYNAMELSYELHHMLEDKGLNPNAEPLLAYYVGAFDSPDKKDIEFFKKIEHGDTETLAELCKNLQARIRVLQ